MQLIEEIIERSNLREEKNVIDVMVTTRVFDETDDATVGRRTCQPLESSNLEENPTKPIITAIIIIAAGGTEEPSWRKSVDSGERKGKERSEINGGISYSPSSRSVFYEEENKEEVGKKGTRRWEERSYSEGKNLCSPLET